MCCKRTAKEAFCIAVAYGTIASPALADPPSTTMRVDGLLDTQAQGGVVVLRGGAESSYASADAMIWAGGTTGEAQPNTQAADAAVFSLTLRAPHGLGEVRLGRFVFSTGAIRPVEIDGGSALVRAPWGTKVEAVAGAPVLTAYGPRDFDWIGGGRVSQTIASRVVVGLSYVEQRQSGELADEEVGADLAAVPVRWLDFAARANYDVLSPGISEALVSAAARAGAFRFEAFASDRSPARLLPDTSLFSIFGDFPSQSAGGDVYWKAAPRLQIWVTGEAQSVGGSYGGNASARARLALDDKGQGSIGIEVRREDVSTAQWTGVRLTATRPIVRTLRASLELVAVAADDPQGKGAWWPWGLLSVGWRPNVHWQLGAALEAASTPEHFFELNALARVSIFWSTK